MANEITLNLALQVQNPSNGTGYKSIIQQTAQFTQNAQGEAGSVISVATGGTTLSTSGLTTQGWMFMMNVDATNYITLNSLVKLKPGEYAVFRLVPGTTLTATANTAAAELWWSVWND